VSTVKRPSSLGDALSAWITRNGMIKRFDLAAAVESWPDAVGPQIAAVTRALSVTPDGTLMVRVASHAWATELGMMAPRILARLNGARRGRVQHIRWLVGPLDQP
jgi:predicted nucleic acid-binding Zn ribbon protein